MKTIEPPGTTRPPRREHVFAGEAASSGIAIGPAVIAREAAMPAVHARLSTLGAEMERDRFNEAVARSIAQIRKLRAKLALLPEASQIEIGSLMEVYQRMLGPSRLQRGVLQRIKDDGLTAEAAVTEETEALATAFLRPAGGFSDEDAAAAERRAGEFREIGQRLVRNLTRMPFLTLGNIPAGAILVTDMLHPSDAALIDPSRVAGVVAEEGGATGHTAIMLQALGIPSVLAASGVLSVLSDALMIIVDGGQGKGQDGSVVVNPEPATLEAARQGVAAYARERQQLGRLRRLSSRLASGEKITLQANLELPAELPLIAQSGAAGIGLLRTEFLFINAETLPDEEQQCSIYASVINAMGPEPTTIRVLDWGGEKPSDALERAGFGSQGDGVNPALGLRGLRLLLRHPVILETQFAAILRAVARVDADHGSGGVQIMLPMVTMVEEVKAAREIYERVARRLRRRGVAIPDPLPPLGIMIETPAAALMAETLAQHADFLALGTNDLTMYTLAVDRAAAEVASLHVPLHPAVLRLVSEVTDAALRQRKPVSICGEIASYPRAAPLLVGLGLRTFSMTASAIPRVKQVIRAMRYEECSRLARQVMAETDPVEVERMLEAFMARG